MDVREQKTNQYAFNLPLFYDERMTDYQIATKTYFPGIFKYFSSNHLKMLPQNISPDEVIEIASFTFKRHLKRILLRLLKHESGIAGRMRGGTGGLGNFYISSQCGTDIGLVR